MDVQDINQIFEILTATNREMRVPQKLEQYKIEKILYDSPHSLVLSSNDPETGKKLAIKCIPIQFYREHPDEYLIMTSLEDPRIIKGLRAFFYPEENPRFFTIVMPRAISDLLDYQNYHDYLPEYIVNKIMKNLLEGIQTLHENHIWHRKLKLEDVLVKGETAEGPEIAICDFGDAAIIDEDQFEGPGIGTYEYAAPELIETKPVFHLKGNVQYTNKVDLWSAGIIMYGLLCGCLPFNPYQEDELERLMEGQVEFDPPLEEDEEAVDHYTLISEEAKDLVRMLLDPDPNQRPDATTALNHAWFQRFPFSPSQSANEQEEITRALNIE